jgi:hypothetical protein
MRDPFFQFANIFFFVSGLWLAVAATEAIRTGVAYGFFGAIRRASSPGRFWATITAFALFSAYFLTCVVTDIAVRIGRVK